MEHCYRACYRPPRQTTTEHCYRACYIAHDMEQYCYRHCYRACYIASEDTFIMHCYRACYIADVTEACMTECDNQNRFHNNHRQKNIVQDCWLPAHLPRLA